MARLTSLIGVATLLLSQTATAKYNLFKTYDATNFFAEFEIQNATDPSSGFVDYVDAATAKALSLAGIRNNNQIYLGADSTTPNAIAGRQSVRVESTDAYSKGLFIADIAHMPANSCGVWPAYWTSGPDWPNSGEIDIIEAINLQKTPIITLHSGKDCVVANTGSAAGSVLTEANCNSDGGDSGCSQSTTDTQAYGDGFNAVKGGVYATRLTTSGIAIWFFPRAGIPADITAGTPDPTTWGVPLVNFVDAGGCDIASHFKSNRFIFNINFCGWAGNTWSSYPQCSAAAATCKEYVAQNPEAFKDAYWLINSLKVYSEATTTKRSFVA
ncbi:hypothetical protein V494_04266 [Pseudogymnoascus sp. VKM F-4513 (FW-928)]|nr:hypothetical protein V494_04266 [Pseudogymnoascus sp. VKM F-4513 (FW-928)]